MDDLRAAFVMGGDQEFMPLIEQSVCSLLKFSKLPVLVYGYDCDIPFHYPNMVPMHMQDMLGTGKKEFMRCIRAIDDTRFDSFISLDGDTIASRNIDSLLKYFPVEHPMFGVYKSGLKHFRIWPDGRKKESWHGTELGDILGIKNPNDFYIGGITIFSRECRWFFEDMRQTHERVMKMVFDIDEFVDDNALSENRLANVIFWKHGLNQHLPITWLTKDYMKSSGALKAYYGDFKVPRYLTKHTEILDAGFDIMYEYTYLGIIEDSKILFFHGQKDPIKAKKLLDSLITS